MNIQLHDEEVTNMGITLVLSMISCIKQVITAIGTLSQLICTVPYVHILDMCYTVLTQQVYICVLQVV